MIITLCGHWVDGDVVSQGNRNKEKCNPGGKKTSEENLVNKQNTPNMNHAILRQSTIFKESFTALNYNSI